MNPFAHVQYPNLKEEDIVMLLKIYHFETERRWWQPSNSADALTSQRLIAGGLVGTVKDLYGLTPKGKGVVAVAAVGLPEWKERK